MTARGRMVREAGCVSPDRGVRGLLPASAVVACVALAARLATLRGPGLHGVVGYDYGVYYAAANALVHGQRPYADFLLLHPPGILLLLAPFAALGSITSDADGMLAARFAFVLLGTLNAVLVTRIAGRFGRAAAIAGGLFYALWPPVVLVESQPRLEPVGNLCVLVALLLLLRPGRPTARAELLAGFALGAGASVKIWGALPLAVILGWHARHFAPPVRTNRAPTAACRPVSTCEGRQWRSVLRIGAGAAMAGVLICVPFLVMAPTDMIRMTVADQLARPRMQVSVGARLHSMSSVAFSIPGTSGPTMVMAAIAMAAIGVAAAAALLLAWRHRSGRVVIALLVAQTALLLSGPSFFPFYSAFVVPAAAITLALAVAQVTPRLRRARPGPRTAILALLAAGVIAAGVALVPIRVPIGRPFPGEQLGAAAGQRRCVLSDTPIALIQMNVLSRDLRNGCRLWIDVTGHTYEGRIALGPDGRLLDRRRNAAWQEKVVGYLTSGDAVVLARGGTGLSQASKRRIARWPIAARIGGYTLYVRPPASR